MKTLEVTLTNPEQAHQLQSTLQQTPGVKSVVVKETPVHKGGTARPVEGGIDPVTILSEASLGESWNSPEDDFWDTADLPLEKR